MGDWKPGDLPKSIEEYGMRHQIWTDLDLIKFVVAAFLAGVFVGWVF